MGAHMIQSPLINLDLAELRRTEALRRLDGPTPVVKRESRSGFQTLKSLLRSRRPVVESAGRTTGEQPIEQPAG